MSEVPLYPLRAKGGEKVSTEDLDDQVLFFFFCITLEPRFE